MSQTKTQLVEGLSINTNAPADALAIGDNGEFGIAGNNYGTSGQVLTSQGSGSAPQWSTIASDKIEEGNTSAEVVDTGSNGHFKVVTESTDALRVDSSQRVLIRTTGTFDSGNGDAVHIASTVGSNVLLGREDTSISGGNSLGQIRYFGQHGGTWRESARIQVTADGGHSASSRPGKISFLTTTATQVSPGEQMALDGNGDLQFNSGYGSVATAYGVRAWVNFTGSGTIFIRESGNVGSITDEGTGDYRINFSSAMPDNEYAVAPCAYAQTGASMVIVLKAASPSGHPMTTSWVAVVSENTSGRFDSDFVTVSVIR